MNTANTLHYHQQWHIHTFHHYSHRYTAWFLLLKTCHWYRWYTGVNLDRNYREIDIEDTLMHLVKDSIRQDIDQDIDNSEEQSLSYTMNRMSESNKLDMAIGITHTSWSMTVNSTIMDIITNNTMYYHYHSSSTNTHQTHTTHNHLWHLYTIYKYQNKLHRWALHYRYQYQRLNIDEMDSTLDILHWVSSNKECMTNICSD